MSELPATTSPTLAVLELGTDERLALIVDVARDTLRLDRAGVAHLRGVLADLRRQEGRPFAKLPRGVTLYPAADKKGVTYWRLGYTVPGHPRRFLQLGQQLAPAYRRALKIAATIAQVRSGSATADEVYRELYVDETKIEVHVDRYIARLTNQKRHPRYVHVVRLGLVRTFAAGGIRRLDQLTVGRLEDAVHKLSTEPASSEGAKDQQVLLRAPTVNKYVNYAKRFAAWAVRRGYAAVNQISDFELITDVDETERRRDMTMAEFWILYAYCLTDRRRKGKGYAGPDRINVYLTAMLTGLRRSELKALQISWFKLDADPPVIEIPLPRVTKNKKAAAVPLPRWFAVEIGKWFAEQAGQAFPRGVPSIKKFDRDCREARAAWIAADGIDAAERSKREASDLLQKETSEGTLVFHSFRHTLATQLLRAKVDLKTAMSITRHGSVELLVERYGHLIEGGAALAIEQVYGEMLPPSAPERPP